MKKHITATIFFLFVGLVTMSAQVKIYFSEKLDAQVLEEKGLNNSQQEKVLNALKDNFNNYMKYGKLLNPKSKEIDRESVANFKDLFTIDARVFNDLREVPESFLWDIDDYIEKARAYFPDYGVSFGIRDGEITSVEYDSRDEYYTFIIKASKSVERFYNAEGDVIRGTQTHDLDFIYTFKLDRLDNIKISVIRGVAGKTPDVYTRLIGGGLGLDFGTASFSETELFNNAKNTGTLDISSGISPNVNAYLYTNFFAGKKNPNKKLFLVLGASIGVQKIVGELRDYSTSGTINVNGEIPNSQVIVTTGIDRVATNVNIDEIQTRLIGKVPLGLGFRLLNNSTNSFFINAQYVPSFAFSSIKNELENGTGNYAIDIAEYNFNSLDINGIDEDSGFATAYNIGKDKSINAKPKIATKFSHGVQLSVVFLKDFIDDSPTWGMAIGGHYYMPLSNLWTYDIEDTVDKPFLYSDDEAYTKQGVLQPFAEKARLSTFGISLTIYRKTNRQP